MTISDYLSNIVNVCVDFLCLDFSVQMVREIQDQTKDSESAVGVDLILAVHTQADTNVYPIIAPSPGRRCSVVNKIAMALQRAAGARLSKLPGRACPSRADR